MKKTIFILSILVALVAVPALAVSRVGELNKLLSDFKKSGDESVLHELCGLAMNSDPLDVSDKVLDVCF